MNREHNRVGVIKNTVIELFNACELLLKSTSASDGMHMLFCGLKECFETSSPDEWQEVIAVCREHSIWTLIQQDPLTRRSFEKPRGYPGDAMLLDLIYRMPGSVAELTSTSTNTGRCCFEYWNNEPGACAVRNRRKVLAHYITEMTQRKKGAKMLAIAAGHLREIELIPQEIDDFNLIAFDQDVASLREIDRCYSNRKITTVEGNILGLIHGKMELGSFDLIYAAGLYDYLNDKIACRLTDKVLNKLNPGGRFLFANFLPDIHAIGYMKACMDWNLIHRTEEELVRIANTACNSIHPNGGFKIKSFIENNRNIGFVEITKSEMMT